MLLKTLYSLCNKEQRYLGIDIGTRSIKAVVLSKGEATIQLNSVIIAELPKGTIENKEIIKPDLFENALKVIRSNIPKSIKNAATAITISNVISKVIQVDQRLTDTEIEYYLYGNLSLVTSKMAEEVNIDFAVIGENKIDDNLKDVFVIVAKKNLINSRVLALKKSGFNCSIVDLESHALLRSLQLQSNLALIKGITNLGHLEGVKANLHIGETTTLLMVMLNGELIFNREVNIGLADLITNACNDLNLGIAEKLTTQLKHYLQNYSSILGGSKIENWFCSGGGSHCPELINFLEHALSSIINRCQPFEQLDCINGNVIATKQNVMPMQGSFQVALGLAARGLI